MSGTIYVWDRFVRFFHWSLVILFVTSYISGEEEHWIHVYSGYTILSLVALRIVWGFIGSRHARFTDFIYPPGKAIDYLKALLSGRKPPRYLGHNPAGGLMVLAMLVTLGCIGFSGLKLYAVKEGEGPFAIFASKGDTGMVQQVYASSDDDVRGDDKQRDPDDEAVREGGEHEDDEEEEFWEELHELAVNLMILLVLLHLVGVFLSSRAHDESLVRAMITGRKRST